MENVINYTYEYEEHADATPGMLICPDMYAINHSSAPMSHPIPLCNALEACAETSSRPNDGHPTSSP